MTVAVVAPPGSNAVAFATQEAVVATDETNSVVGSAAYIDLATVGPTVTVNVPVSGRVIVTIGCQVYNNNSDQWDMCMSFAASGANTIAASDAMRLWNNTDSNHDGAMDFQSSRSWLLTGLTAGSTTFTAKYRHSSSAGASHFLNRQIRVQPVDADAALGGTAAFTTVENYIATDQTTTSSTPTDLATVGPAVTITVPASGKVKVTFSCDMYQGGTNVQYMGYALSGANTVAVNGTLTDYLVLNSQRNGSNGYGGGVSTLLTGLTPGGTTFTAKYASDGTETAHFFNRYLRVEPVDGDLG